MFQVNVTLNSSSCLFSVSVSMQSRSSRYAEPQSPKWRRPGRGVVLPPPAPGRLSPTNSRW